MRITVEFPDDFRTLCGVKTRTLELAGRHVTVEVVLTRLAGEVPTVAEYLPRTACMIGTTLVGRDTELRNGLRLRLVPPDIR